MDIRKMINTESDLEELKKNLLDLDSEFRFKCRRCGKCCKNQDTIVLTPRDVFNIARKLGKTISKVIEDYAEVYIGQDTHIPVVHLLSNGPQNTCPLLADDRCSVHDCKPTVCALYPLGRVMIAPKPGESEQVRYMLMDYACGSAKKINTVRSWLQKFGIPESDDFFILWSKTVYDSVIFVQDMEKKGYPPKLFDIVWTAFYNTLYTQYNTSQDFFPQFQAAVKQLIEFYQGAQDIFQKALIADADGT